MRWAVATSLGLHAAILIAALIVLPSPHHDVPPVQAIQVDITQIGDATKKMAMAKDVEKPADKPAPKKTETTQKTDPKAKVADEVKKAAKEPQSAPPPEPKKEEPKKEEPKKEVAKKEPPPDPADMAALLKKTVEDPPKKPESKKQETKTAEAKPKDKPKPPDKKAQKKKSEKLDINQMEAFLNKIDGESTAPVETSSIDGTPAKGEANLQGTDDQMVGTIIDALVSRVKQCWSVPPGAREANITVRVHFELTPQGKLTADPSVENGSADPVFDATARSAVAAVIECQDYGFLPQEQYDLWKSNTLDFNPNLMFQG